MACNRCGASRPVRESYTPSSLRVGTSKTVANPTPRRTANYTAAPVREVISGLRYVPGK